MTDEKISKVIKETIEKVFPHIEDDFGANVFKITEVPHEHCSGFWASTNGGWKATANVSLRDVIIYGAKFGIRKIDESVKALYRFYHAIAVDRFINNHPEYKGKKVTYEILAKKDNKLAEEFDALLYDDLLDNCTFDLVFQVQLFLKGDMHAYGRNNSKTHISMFAYVQEYKLLDKTITVREGYEKVIETQARKAYSVFDKVMV